MLDFFKDLNETLETFRHINLSLNLTKCTFSFNSGNFLGRIVFSLGLQASLEKITTLTKMRSPRNLKEMQTLTNRLFYPWTIFFKSGRQ